MIAPVISECEASAPHAKISTLSPGPLFPALRERASGSQLTPLDRSGRGCGHGPARLALGQHPVAARRELRAQDELALKTARLKTAVCLGDLIEGDPLGDTRPDVARFQQAEEPLQVLPEPRGMQRPHQVYRVDAEALAARQQPPP